MKSYLIRFAASVALTALTAALLPVVTTTANAQLYPPYAQCADGIDNDRDGAIDYPQDEGCLSLEDDSESASGRGIFITVSDGIDNVRPGNSLAYTITLRTERDEAMNTNVRFLLPHQTNLQSASDGGRREGVYVNWYNVSVFPGVPKKLYVNVQASPRSQEGLLLVAEASANGEKATDTTTVSGTPRTPSPLIITVDDGKSFARPSDLLTYRITVRNSTSEDQVQTVRTTLHPQLGFTQGSSGYVREERDVEWRDQLIRARETREYFITARVERNTADFIAVTTRVFAGPAIGTDSTTIISGPIPTEKILAISDNLKSVRAGEEITYDVTVRNNGNALATDVDVKVSLPHYTDFVGAEEGGYWVGNAVRWQNLTISPYGTRTLRITARVRTDAPNGAQLRASALVQGTEAVDITEVSNQRVQETSPLNLQSRSSSTPTVSNANGMVSKVADRSEVRPGDTVWFTVTVRNTKNVVLRDILVEDRLDSPYMSLAQAENGTYANGRITWNIPSLEPGKTWSVRYAVHIAENAPHGLELRNIVTISGPGMESTSLTERVHTTRVGVLTKLPATGAAWDLLSLIAFALTSMVPTAALRKRLV